MAFGATVGAAALPAQAAEDSGGSVAAKIPVKLHPQLPFDSAFGWAVAASGDAVVVGAPFDDPAGRDAGSTAVYTAVDGTWIAQDGLIAADAASGDYFGYAVALDGDTVLVGAPNHDPGGASDAGAAYVFVRDGSTWTQQAKLAPSEDPESYTGYSVALQGDTAVLGTYGAAGDGAVYVFTRSGATWTQLSMIENPDRATIGFGVAVAIDGETLVVGQTGDDDRGSAYVFVGSGATWVQQAQLLPTDPNKMDGFGAGVDVSADTVVVGARFDTTTATYGGSAYIFVRSGTSWSQQAYLFQEEASFLDTFGTAVAVGGNIAIIGSSKTTDPNAGASGAAYIYGRDGTTWTQKRELLPPLPLETEFFGGAVDVTRAGGGASRTLVIGATNDESSGSAYVYR